MDCSVLRVALPPWSQLQGLDLRENWAGAAVLRARHLALHRAYPKGNAKYLQAEVGTRQIGDGNEICERISPRHQLARRSV